MGETLIDKIAHDILINRGICWARIFDSIEEMREAVTGFNITLDDMPNILANYDTAANEDYTLTPLEARFICRCFAGHPVLEKIYETETFPTTTSTDVTSREWIDATTAEIFKLIFEDYVECCTNLQLDINTFMDNNPWGIWYAETKFYKLAPNAMLAAVGKDRQTFVRDAVINTYGRFGGRRKIKCVEAPKPISIF